MTEVGVPVVVVVGEPVTGAPVGLPVTGEPVGVPVVVVPVGVPVTGAPVGVPVPGVGLPVGTAEGDFVFSQVYNDVTLRSSIPYVSSELGLVETTWNPRSRGVGVSPGVSSCSKSPGIVSVMVCFWSSVEPS